MTVEKLTKTSLQKLYFRDFGTQKSDREVKSTSLTMLLFSPMKSVSKLHVRL